MMTLRYLWPLRRPVRTLHNLRKWVGNPLSEQDVIFIVGAPRSGTTLLKTLLVAHSHLVGTDYESTGLFRVRDFYSYQMGELAPELVLQRVKDNRHLVRLYEQLSQDLLEQSSASRFVDKLTVQPWRMKFVVRHFPNARFLNIVRDGRDCLCSARRHPNVQQSESVDGFARYWRQCVITVESTIPAAQRFTIRYEDLTDNPTEQLSAAMRWLGLGLEDQQLDPSVYSPSIAKREVHRNLRNPVNTESQNRWRRELSPSDAADFHRIAEDALALHGYSPA